MHQRVAEAERVCGHHFENQELIVSALTHPSVAEGMPVSSSYERLEFLGDSILGAIAAVIVTRNARDFGRSAIPVRTPEEFFSWMERHNHVAYDEIAL